MRYRTGPSTGPTWPRPAASSPRWPTTPCSTARRGVATRATRGRTGCGATTSTRRSDPSVAPGRSSVPPTSVLCVRVTAEAGRRFLVARHALAPARSLDGGHDAVLEVFRRLGSIQFDPLAVAGRTHDLVLHARVGDYDPAWCDDLYERREIFE